jgi:hypothetical protein
MRDVGETKHTTGGDPLSSKTKTIFGPLSETGTADRGTSPNLENGFTFKHPPGFTSNFFGWAAK